MKIRVIAVGQPYGGDDAVGFAVAADLKSRGIPAGVEVVETTDSTRLPGLMTGVDRVIVVDAVLEKGKRGEILILAPEELETAAVRPVSTHGIGVIEALRLGRSLLSGEEEPEIFILGIRIPEALRFTEGLTPEVAAAVPNAVDILLGLFGDRRRWALEIGGTVQGVGFRPFIYRLALDHGLSGFVKNRSDGVSIEIQGSSGRLDSFFSALDHPPPLARIESCRRRTLPLQEDETTFEIRESDGEGSPLPVIPPDAAVCPDCLREVRDPADRRYRYPFANCTHCGPRWTIVEAVPYDRPNTTLKGFPLCDDCRREYEDPADRRFDAQPIACPVCGPQLEGYDPQGTLQAVGDEALQLAVDHLRSGKILALKGLGGFQLLVDATDEKGVSRLRELKRREEKPFAVMFPSLDNILRVASPTEGETALLQSPEAPIVLVRKISDPLALSSSKGEPSDLEIASGISPDNPYLGAMLPYTPLHHLLMDTVGRPIVCTSGNLRDEPICIENDEALKHLSGIADFFLAHNRPIARPVDDSVLRVIDGASVMIRRARGYAPRSIPLSRSIPPLLAVGAHLKSTVAVSVGNRAIVSQHIGDLETAETMEAFRRTVDNLLHFYQVKPEGVVCDLHPDYLSTRYAEEFAAERRIPLIRVQHHHAHIAACMAEHNLDGEVLGIAWDGTGYGPDGTLWGGEFLLCDGPRFRRLGHLRPFPLPGGEAAIREPRRTALGLLLEAGLSHDDPALSFTPKERETLHRMIDGKMNAPIATGVGRLFDGIAALLGLRQRNSFEGQAAMALEYVTVEGRADTVQEHPMLEDGISERVEHYSIPLLMKGELWMADWSPMLRAILKDRICGVPAPLISIRFHHALAELAVTAAHNTGINRVVLSGGCFQNSFLSSLVLRRLKEEGFQPYVHYQVPPNDGGISLGQIFVGEHQRMLTENKKIP